MDLTTPNGQLDLPSDFSLELERTNPLMSDQGDASVPATLPSSPRNLAVLGHLERIDHAVSFNPYLNKVEAIMQVGPVQKRGQLVIDTVHRTKGIDASFAIDSSDLYATAKKKSLKDIFAEYNYGDGMKETFESVQAACEAMQDIYVNGNPDGDYLIFPVAIAAYETGDGDEKTTTYQFNNEDSGGGNLVWQERIVREGDINMLVPNGYGIAPFLKLNRMLQRLFECLGYTVTYNIFDELGNDKIVIVHNCSDCLVRPTLLYADLVPSCTLSEFLDWLLAKFHVQPIVDSETKTAKIVSMERLLNSVTGNYDMDISDLVEGDFKLQLNPSKRIVLTPTCEIEGTKPAEETFDKLINKYGFFVDVDEAQFASLTTDNPYTQDCLVRRKATGMFYLLERRLDNGAIEPHELGSNYFTYDRDNSDETEAYSQSDTMPRMWVGDNAKVAPFIGERIHRHTSYKGKADDSEQKIIVVQAYTLNKYLGFPTSGTTQQYLPRVDGLSVDFHFGMDNYSMHLNFWQHYNATLLNNPLHLIGRVRYSIDQFLRMDMSAMKLCRGQRLIPVSASARLGQKMSLAEAEFIRYELLDGDSPFLPSSRPNLHWERATYYNGEPFDEAAFVADLYQFILDDQAAHGIAYINPTFIGYEVEYDAHDAKTIWLGTPQEIDETRRFAGLAHYKITFEYDLDHGRRHRATLPNQYSSAEFVARFDHDVTVVFTAVPYDAEVEYLESTGTQYINLGLMIQEDDVIEIEAAFITKSGLNYLMGASATYGRSPVYIMINNGRGYAVRFGSEESLNVNNLPEGYWLEWRTYTLKKGYFIVDGDDMGHPGFSSITRSAFSIFGATSPSGFFPGCAKIRSVKIVRDGNEFMSLKSVRIGNVGYMYDKVRRRFYENNGTDAFIIGSDKT